MIYPRFSADINSPSLMICDAAISALHTKFALKSATRLALDARLITTDSAIQYAFLNMAAFNVFSGLGIFVWNTDVRGGILPWHRAYQASLNFLETLAEIKSWTA